jgi:long-chain fatty acid transport protein
MLALGKMTAASALRAIMLGSVASAAMAAASAGAIAGGFAVREQSAEFQGMSFAGNAAGGGGLSGMFWNPAVAAEFNGVRSESHFSIIFPDSEINALPGTTLISVPGLDRSSGDIGETAVVPAGYLSYQLSQQLVLGASFNAPFGLSTKPDNRAWVGQTQARDTIVRTYNGQIALGYRLLPTLNIGGGVMIEYIDADLKSASGAAPSSPDSSVRGNDTSVGWTAGITWQALPGTNIGVGYRSQIEHTLSGSALIDTTTRSVGVKAGVTLPETATISLRQALTPQLALLATAEWTKWSRLDKLDVVCQAREAALCPGGAGTLATTLPFNWHDSWFYSAGLEYAWNPGLTLRAGGAWERSPVQNPSERSPRVPDNDRIWGSVGATAKVNDTVSVDFAYTHIWVDDGQIDRTASSVRLLADVKSDIDNVSGSIKIKLGAPPEPLK